MNARSAKLLTGVVSLWMALGCSSADDNNRKVTGRTGISRMESAISLDVPATLGNGRYQIKVTHTGMCLDVPWGSGDNGALLQQVKCNGNIAQLFDVEKVDGRFYRIRSAQHGKSLDIIGVNKERGTRLHQWDYVGGPNQQFALDQQGDGSYLIRPRHTGLALDVESASMTEGAKIVQWDTHAGPQQRWQFLAPGATVAPGGGNLMTFANRCNQTIWVGALSGEARFAIPNNGGFKLDPGQSMDVNLAEEWSGRFWPRTGCQQIAGELRCATGDCGSRAQCAGIGGRPPATLIEFTFGGHAGLDYYDISFVDGFNVPVSIAPKPGTFVKNGGDKYDCTNPTCRVDLNASCPERMRMRDGSGRTVACLSGCEAFNDDLHCCRGAHNVPATCPATAESDHFKNQCPDAYSYAYDDVKSTYTCWGKAYDVVFCP
jgi:hypothetical protein